MAHAEKQGPTVTLKNKSRQMVVINLPYQILGSGYMRRQVVGSLTWVHDTQLKGQVKRARGGNKRLSESMRLLGKGREGDTAHGLPPAIERCPDVAGALKAGQIQLIKVSADDSRKQADERKAAAKKAGEAKKAEAERLKKKAEAKTAAQVKALDERAKKKPARKAAAPPTAPPPEPELEATKSEPTGRTRKGR